MVKKELIRRTKDQALGELARQVTHDLRSPISALNVFSKKVHFSNDEEEKFFNQIIERINSIATDLLKKSSLSISQAEEAYIITNSQETDISEIDSLLQKIIAEKRTCSDKMIEIFYTFPEDKFLKQKIYIENIETHRLESIVSNLIDNSLDAFSKKITIDLKFAVKNAREVIVISISDDGRGIDESTLTVLGSRSGITKGKNNGNGIALYSAIKIIKSWRGELNIYSTINMGTTVTMKLPVFKS